jgi:CheY-like chemotaxis protein
MLLREVLQSAGANVIEAEHGEQALRMLSLHQVDGVVTDLAMPMMDGHALIDRLRVRYGEALPIVVCSAAVMQAQRLFTSGRVQGAVSKPFNPQHLVQAVEVAFASAPPVAQQAAV